MKRPCISCGIPTAGARCPQCEAGFRRKKDAEQTAKRRAGRGAFRPYSSAGYRNAAKAIRENATQCAWCGGGARPDDPWQADHVVAGDPNSQLVPAHRSCNIRRANKARAKRP